MNVWRYHNEISLYNKYNNKIKNGKRLLMKMWAGFREITTYNQHLKVRNHGTLIAPLNLKEIRRKEFLEPGNYCVFKEPSIGVTHCHPSERKLGK
jgi:hypothetical protein